ncbi:MAG TPA: hypothetical protein VJ599_05630, partial [Nitrososphaeraceae archaeon]|nr:hypothetical protein [Nitrososphaeraceae archaeon]
MSRQKPVLTFFIIMLVLEAFFFVGNIIPLEALSKQGQLLNNDYPQRSIPIIKISTTSQGTFTATSNTEIDAFNSTSSANNEQSKLIDDLVNTGKLTEDEAKEIITRVMLINELVQTGKFTEEEAKEFVTNVMNNETDDVNITNGGTVPEVPETNMTTTVPEVPEVPETNITEVPETNMTTTVPEVPEVPETNITEVPETNITEVPETNITEVPETNITEVPETN